MEAVDTAAAVKSEDDVKQEPVVNEAPMTVLSPSENKPIKTEEPQQSKVRGLLILVVQLYSDNILAGCKETKVQRKRKTCCV